MELMIKYNGIIKHMKSLDEIILERRSVRNFTADIPPEDEIKLILKAGMHAPYAALAA